MKTLFAGLAAAAVGVAAPAAFAGAVSVQSGTVQMSFEPAGDDGETAFRSTPVSFPGSQTVEWDGGDAGNGQGFRGRSTATYALQDTGTGALFDVDLTTSNLGEPVTSGSTTAFTLAFTTDSPLRYRLDATPGRGRLTNLQFDDFSATAETDAFGTHEGTWPAVTGPGAFIVEFTDVLREGVLPAGAHTLLLEIGAGIDRGGEGQSNEAGLRLALTPTDDGGATPNPIPLPPAAWTGLSAMAGVAGSQFLRRRRAGR